MRRVTRSHPNLASPDPVGASIDVSAGALTLTFAFVPGTLSANVQSVAFLGTRREHGDRGSLSGDGGLLGADYIIALVDEWNSGRGAIARWDGQVFRRVGTAPVAFTGTKARIAFPTSLLGNDDGRLTYKIHLSHWLGENQGSSSLLDRVTEIGAAPGGSR